MPGFLNSPEASDTPLVSGSHGTDQDPTERIRPPRDGLGTRATNQGPVLFPIIFNHPFPFFHLTIVFLVIDIVTSARIASVCIEDVVIRINK